MFFHQALQTTCKLQNTEGMGPSFDNHSNSATPNPVPQGPTPKTKPKPYSLETLASQTWSLSLNPLNPKPQPLNPKPWAPDPNPNAQTLIPKSLNPNPANPKLEMGLQTWAKGFKFSGLGFIVPCLEFSVWCPGVQV